MKYPLFNTTLFHPLGQCNFRSNPFQQHFMATLLTERATKCSLQSPPPFRKPVVMVTTSKQNCQNISPFPIRPTASYDIFYNYSKKSEKLCVYDIFLAFTLLSI